MFACCVFTNFEEPSTKLAWPVASTSKNLENLSDKQSRYWRPLIDKIHKNPRAGGDDAPQLVLEPHVAHINRPQLQELCPFSVTARLSIDLSVVKRAGLTRGYTLGSDAALIPNCSSE